MSSRPNDSRARSQSTACKLRYSAPDFSRSRRSLYAWVCHNPTNNLVRATHETVGVGIQISEYRYVSENLVLQSHGLVDSLRWQRQQVCSAADSAIQLIRAFCLRGVVF